MFTRILLPLDGTARSEEALRYARELAHTSDAHLYLLHVDEPDKPSTDELSTTHKMERIANALHEEQIVAQVISDTGSVAPAITATVDQDAIELIVLAPESRTLLNGMRHPSVTAQVFAQSTVPVLIAPNGTQASAKLLEFGDAQVIVPLDGSPRAEKALPLALRLAREYHRALLLAHVIPPARVFTAGVDAYALMPDTTEADQRIAAHYLSEVRTRLVSTEAIPIHTMVLEGAAAPALLALAETKQGSLIVMSTHGRTGLTRLVLGSVALELARKTPIPMIVIPTVTVDHADAETAAAHAAHQAFTH